VLFMALSMAGWASATGAAAGGWQFTSVRVNGVPLELRRGELAATPSEISTAVLARWSARGTAVPQVAAIHGRIVIGRQRGRLHETVSLGLAGPGRTSVLVAVSDLGARLPPPARLPAGLPAGQRVLQVIETVGGRVTERAFTLESGRDPSVALAQWRRALAASGWSPRVAATGAGGGLVLWADRGRERLDAVFVAAPEGARIVIQVTGDAH
jgi:hypothetical protein